ncbi:energy-coupling factor ABC transporter permease [Peptostreptococcus sp. D1]|uniref:energy-coupling factor ABC transporter permease n=1 Tax=Peptostreptococcus sp. D1 TaxID=72304 RepID=UPI0008EE7342|nr:energy-coupling factor ABC transporter permease [Peptostreptococcus sp. D1]SFE27551.1 cobalamin biosynthesis protein CbiM [Peptostreptococcus sp. D1]
MYNSRERKAIIFTLAITFILLMFPDSNAMYIMEGYLLPMFCISWSVVCLAFLAHCRLKTLGASIFSMTIAGPFVTYGIYYICKKAKINNHISNFFAAALGDLITYCVTRKSPVLCSNRNWSWNNCFFHG